MKKRRKKAAHPYRAVFALLCVLCVGAAVGFVGGLYFSQSAPHEAGRITDTIHDGMRHIGARVRIWWSGAGTHGCEWIFQASPDSEAAGAAPVEVFFAPARVHHEHRIDDALLRLINGAQQRILCAFYDFELENIARALIARHAAGVSVGIVSDSDYADRPGVVLCMEAGIPVVFDNRSALMHNKFCVVDDRYVWTGSTNITENCMYRNNNNAILVDSPRMAVNFSNEFDEMFTHRQFGPSSPANTPYPTITVAGIGLETYFAPEDGVEQAIIARLAESQRNITFMAFVFTSVPISEAMAARMEAGTRVRGLIERRSAGSRFSRHAYLRERGADIYIDANTHTMHHKVMIVDARLVMTGSYNFSANAETRNDENLVMIHCRHIAARFLEEFEAIIP